MTNQVCVIFRYAFSGQNYDHPSKIMGYLSCDKVGAQEYVDMLNGLRDGHQYRFEMVSVIKYYFDVKE